ncbi:uncharacterized protein LOC112588738 [Harpegnathos saltator]|uniref:uncharacterized protein LOC112588738 n=1 Tax=Harpegnathos saltator TaxID=610380 RepID=UPI000DBEDBFE|nr:uncharacterized protein LOC112588738 [Harpegnathos saltator]
MVMDRTVRYEDSVTLGANIRYPMVLDDRLSLELNPLAVEFERELLESEDDISDNNLSIAFEHRLSLSVRLCARCLSLIHEFSLSCLSCRDRSIVRIPVRLSLRSSMNEYHEIAYWFELECEEASSTKASIDGAERLCRGANNEEDTESSRLTRHRAIAAVFRSVALPMLAVEWPDGLSRESLPRTPERPWLNDHKRPVRMISGESFGTHQRLFEHLVNTAIANEDTVDQLRLKYDSERTYDWYAMDEFWVDSERVANVPAAL